MPISFSVPSLLLNGAAESGFSVFNTGNQETTVQIQSADSVLFMTPRVVQIRPSMSQVITVKRSKRPLPAISYRQTANRRSP